MFHWHDNKPIHFNSWFSSQIFIFQSSGSIHYFNKDQEREIIISFKSKPCIYIQQCERNI